MASSAMPGDGGQPFHAQPVPALNHKQRGQKHPRRGKNRQHHPYAGSTDGPPKNSQAQSCFNCGSLEHWAQQCPEPRREFPAGSMRPGRPPKRQKTTGSHISSNAGDPHYNHSHRPPQRGYTHPPVAHSGYQPAPMSTSPYGPPTPISVHPHSAGPWSQEHPPPHYNSPQSYGLPTPMGGYGSQFASPSTSMPPHQGHFPPHYSPQYGKAEYHRKSFDHRQQILPQAGSNRQSRKKWRRLDNVSAIAAPIEPWMEELQSLDIPDSGANQVEIVWRPAVQVARPLPSTFDERDDVGMLPPFTSLPPGMSVSKYILDKGPEEFVSNIRNTEDWPFVMSDPIFLEISMECELIPLDELIARRKLIFKTHRVEPPPVVEEASDTNEDNGYNEADESDDDKEANEYQEREVSIVNSNEESHERATNRSHSGEWSRTPSHTSQADHGDGMSSPRSYPADDRESLREASPEVADHPASPSPRTYYGHHDSHDHESSRQTNSINPGRGRSNDKRRGNQRTPRDRTKQMEVPNRKASQQEGRRNAPFDRRGGRGSHFNSQDRRKPKPQHFKGTNKPKTKKGPNNRGHPSNQGDSGVRNSKNRDSQFGMDGNTGPDHTNNPQEHQRSKDHAEIQQMKPFDQHSRHGQVGGEDTGRKRSRHDESPTRPEEPRRQEDDITPKLKRRQPHVAEAYSRRW
ncbi:hypothetical protein BDBG_01043 [Blastomyces gilchristii SLH14081]|uniref:CCHC-type domain-containing protein n=1 Tax=Blastomyces gilchristii (strain SLH14081) TaxID=559298 RepID=A0A179UB22_BLAGS|nr:uncharacterized protein BDBG_01043 [Blastomyces gilchristii SLH14081]OAT04498.1 hypothetical protein BDBG_01043 [Blastomyces gilchristii SLH14081]